MITTIKYVEGAVLPVNLLELKAEYRNGITNLNWKTLSETNTSHFEIQRGFNGSDFNVIGNVGAAGNSSSMNQYVFIDGSPARGNNFYRLKLLDADGKSGYSRIIMIKTGDDRPSIDIFPNPVTEKTLVFQLNSYDKGSFQVELYNSVGQVVYKTGIDYQGGSLIQTLKLPGNIVQGFYHLKIYSGNVRVDRKLVIQ